MFHVEHFNLLERYVALLEKWNRAINLIGKSTADDIWKRHIEDSLQLLPLIPESASRAVDLGSGAGLPGLVLAIAQPTLEMTLVEQDQRKAAFLQEAVATLALPNVRVLNQDLHTLKETFSLVTARALAPLEQLFSMAYPLSEKNTVCLFPKGTNYATELTSASQSWQFDHVLTDSKLSHNSVILSIRHLSPKGNV